jgi:hypothetical protein
VPDRPSAPELVEAVAEFLEREVLPLMTDHRMKFRTLVALNALGIASRELAAEPGPDDAADLARRVRERGADPALLPELERHVAAKLRVSNPRYLEGELHGP